MSLLGVSFVSRFFSRFVSFELYRQGVSLISPIESSEATGDRDGHTQPLLYFQVSLGSFVRFAFPFAFRFVRTLQGVSLMSPI